MEIKTVIYNLDIIFASAIAIIFFIKIVIFKNSKKDNTPSDFFYNERYAIHATTSKSLKRKKKIQNRLTLLLAVLIAALLIFSFVFKSLLEQ